MLGALAVVLAIGAGGLPGWVRAQETVEQRRDEVAGLAAVHLAYANLLARIRLDGERQTRTALKQRDGAEARAESAEARVDKLRADVAALEASFDQETVKQMRRYRRDLLRLMGQGSGDAAPQALAAADTGANALLRFFAGEEAEALRTLDQLASDRRAALRPAREREDAADTEPDRKLTADNQRERDRRRGVQDALDLRIIANLFLLAQTRQRVPLQVVIDRFREVVKLDPSEATDSVILARLYRQAGDLEATKAAAGEALRLAVVDGDRALALGEVGSTLRQAGLLELARQALEEAFKLRERAWRAASGDADAQRYLSVAHERLGELALDEGRFTLAAEHFDKVVELRQPLLADMADARRKPEVDASGLAALVKPRAWASRDLAVAWAQLFRARLELGDLNKAGSALGEALRLSRKLVETETDALEPQRDLAVLLAREGDLALLAKQTERAEAAYDQSFRMRWDLLRRDPQSARLLRDVAAVLIRQGDLLLSKESGAAAALDAYAKAERFLRDAAGSTAEPADLARDQVRLLVRQSRAQAQAGDPQKALRGFQTAQQALSKADKAVPGQFLVMRDLADLHIRTGDALMAMPYRRGDSSFSTARNEFQKARERWQTLRDKEPRSRVLRAMVWHSLNRLTAAHERLNETAEANKTRLAAAREASQLLDGPGSLDGIPEADKMLVAAAELAEAHSDYVYAEKLRPVVHDMRKRKLLGEAQAAKLDAIERRARSP